MSWAGCAGGFPGTLSQSRSWSTRAAYRGPGRRRRQEGVPVAQERGDGHGRGGLPDVNPTLERAFGRWSRARLIDAARHVEAGGAIAETEAVGDVAEDMDPTRLAGDLGIDVVKSGMEPTMAVGATGSPFTYSRARRS